MRTACALALLALALGCSDTKPQDTGEPLTAEETASMPQITMAEVNPKLQKPGGKALLVLLWRAETEATMPTLATADKLAAAHAKAGLEILALNIDMPNDVRQKAMPLLQKAGLSTLKVHAYQDDVMGLGATLDFLWGGETPAAFLYDRKGTQVYKGHGKDAFGQAAAKVPGLLAAK
ncbi:hypothetical protein ACFL09_04185 [Planctomycetota bacterium]